MDQSGGYSPMGFFEMYESMDHPVKMRNGSEELQMDQSRSFSEPAIKMDQSRGYSPMGFFEMYESMDHPVEMRNGSEELQMDESRSFSEPKFPYTDEEILGTRNFFYKSQKSYVGMNSHTATLLPRRSLHKQTFMLHRKLVGNSTTSACLSSAEHGNGSFRNHPSAPPNRYSFHFQQRKLRHLHNLPLQQSQPKKLFRCTHVNTCRNTTYTRRQSRSSISKPIGTASLGLSMRNFPIAPSPYISQLKHNEMTSRYIANLAAKTKNLYESQNSSCGIEDGCAKSFIRSREGEVESCTSSSFSSPESQHHFIASSSKLAKENDTAPFLNYRDRNAFQNMFPLTVNTSKADSTKKSQVQAWLAEKSNRCSERTVVSNNVSPHSDEPELPRCIATSQTRETVEITPEKIIEDSYDELETTCHSFKEENTEGLKLDVSFSFMEKGGYHPIALPLGCHIFEDESDGSENEEERTSVLDKRMAKMGRDEFQLNVDTSSSYMPWIIIPLDDIPKVRYECVDFYNPEDPRLTKYKKSLELSSMNVESAHLFCDTSHQKAGMASEIDQMQTEVQTADYIFNVENMDTNKESTHESPNDLSDLPFTDLFLQINADSFEFHDNLLDALTQETVDADTENKLPQYQGSDVMQTGAQEDFRCFQQNEISTASDEKALQESTAIFDNATTKSTGHFDDLSSNNGICKFNSHTDISSSSNEQSKDVENSSVKANDISSSSNEQFRDVETSSVNANDISSSSNDQSRDVETSSVNANDISSSSNEQFRDIETSSVNANDISTSSNEQSKEVETSSVNAKTDSKTHRHKCGALKNDDENEMPYSEDSSNSTRTMKLPVSTIQLLKESAAFLKDENLSTSRVRRLRRVSTSLRVADFALPNFLEDFYMESESCNYAERLKGTSFDGDSCESDKSMFDKGIRNKNVLPNDTESIRIMPRRTKRTADTKTSSPDANLSSKSCHLKKADKRCTRASQRNTHKGSSNPQSVHEGHTAKCRKHNDEQKPKDNLFLKYEGRNYKCMDGILTPAICEDSTNTDEIQGGEDHLLNNIDHDQNAPKTGYNVKMRNGVVKRKPTSDNRNTNLQLSNCKKSRSSQSPKVMVRNCFQQIAFSQTKCSKTLTTTRTTVDIIQKTTQVRKKLFPVKVKKSQNTGKGTSQQKTKGAKSVEKKQSTGKQKQTSTKSIQKKPVEKKHTSNVDVKVPKHEEDVLTDSKQQNQLSVACKPIIRIHQGLRNTSLKQFKAHQHSKGIRGPTIKKNPQKAFPCSHCEKSFNKAAQVERHIKDDHKCSQCGKMFDLKVAKQRHFYSCHATEVHKCTTCLKEYNYPHLVRKHFESQSHKDLIKNLIREMKKLSKERLSARRMPSLEYGNLNPAMYQNKASNKCLTMSDKFLKARSNKKLKFMEMESNFFDKNPDLLELVHKINYVDNEHGIIKHFIYKDPDLAEIQSYQKDEVHSSSSCYEEIEIINEYSITNHCENFLENADNDFAFSNSSRSSELRCSSTSISSEFSEENQEWSISHHTTDPCMGISSEPLTYSHMNCEISPLVSGWVSAALECTEQRNLDDDLTYSTYLGLLSNEAGMELPNNPITLDTLSRSPEENPPKIVESCQELCHFPTEAKAPVNSIVDQLKEQNLCLSTSYKNTLNFQEKSSLLPFIPNAEEAISYEPKSSMKKDISSLLKLGENVSDTSSNLPWKSPSQAGNDTLDVAFSLIMLSNSEQDVLPKVDELSNSTGPSRDDMDAQQEYESICLEIQRDVQNYKE